jgi:hypothetical protein
VALLSDARSGLERARDDLQRQREDRERVRAGPVAVVSTRG